MKKAGEFHPLEILKRLWQEISINIIRPLSKSNGQDTIMVIVDQFIKLKATITVISSKKYC